MATWRRLLFLFGLPILLFSRPTKAGELGGAVNLRDGIVHVEVDDDGKPAVGVKVRLQEAVKKEVVAQGKINAEGEWSWPILKAGTYEVVIEPADPGQQPLVYPIDVREKGDPSLDAKKCGHCPAPLTNPSPSPPDEARFPWLPVGLGLGALGSCGVVVWFNRFRGKPESTSDQQSCV